MSAQASPRMVRRIKARTSVAEMSTANAARLLASIEEGLWDDCWEEALAHTRGRWWLSGSIYCTDTYAELVRRFHQAA